MHFSTSEVIHAPREAVFAEVTDFDAVERQIVKAGGSLTRTGGAGPDAAWQGHFRFRGTERDFTSRVGDWTPPGGYRLISATTGLDALVDVRCVAVDAATTRLEILVDLKPRSMKAKILLNSLKLMRSQINARFKQRIQKFADHVAQKAGNA